MKFKSIIIKDDPVLGDVSLDFELDSNEIADYEDYSSMLVDLYT